MSTLYRSKCGVLTNSVEQLLAIWDNRSVIHQATFDYDAYGERFGWRVSATGEPPFLDPSSLSRREVLKIEGNIL